MIRLTGNNRSVNYSIYHIIRAFLPDEEIIQADCPSEDITGGQELLLLEKDGEELFRKSEEKLDKERIETAVYDLLAKLSGTELPWGTLTGVRPVKLAREKLENMSPAQAEAFLTDEKRVTSPKASLCINVALKERELIRKLFGGQDKDYGSYSIYVGIPVCPSICSYCSFSSGPLSVWKDRMDDYTDALIRELKMSADMLAKMKLTSVYIGGGTPTVLTPAQMERLLICLEENFQVRRAIEYTLEAGRPDTITEEKLIIAKEHGVNRLSVNPQSMQQKTLDLIGRNHTVSQVREAFYLSRSLGFDNINMDIIAGLPGEDESDMEDTLRQIAELSPDSLTVHALAIKRAARMTRQSTASTVTGRMIEAAAKGAAGAGMEPYYLYRQKSIAGNHENTGYACPGKEGIYNVMIMEEVQSIAAFGAGATSKVLLPQKVQNPDRAEGVMTDLLRQDNPVSIPEYIEKAEEMAKNKEKTFDNIILPCYYTRVPFKR